MKTEDILRKFGKETHLVAYRGSISHGTFIPAGKEESSDDIDLISMHMNPIEHYLGLFKFKETLESFEGKYDIVSYEFKKFVRMLLNCNPNIMSVLWLDKEYILKNTFYSRAILDNKEWFLSKKVYSTYVGYAHSELKRITKDKQYQGYMGAKRKLLVDRIGYDSKNASHCIRLLRMCCECLRTGNMQINRTIDRQELIDIKLGKYSFNEIVDEANGLFSIAAELYKHTDLPDKPQVSKVNGMVMGIMSDYVNINYKV